MVLNLLLLIEKQKKKEKTKQITPLCNNKDNENKQNKTNLKKPNAKIIKEQITFVSELFLQKLK